MTKKDNNAKARAIYDASGMSCQEFASAIGLSYWTVEQWWRPKANATFRGVSDTRLKYLKMLAHDGTI